MEIVLSSIPEPSLRPGHDHQRFGAGASAVAGGALWAGWWARAPRAATQRSVNTTGGIGPWRRCWRNGPAMHIGVATGRTACYRCRATSSPKAQVLRGVGPDQRSDRLGEFVLGGEPKSRTLPVVLSS